VFFWQDYGQAVTDSRVSVPSGAGSLEATRFGAGPPACPWSREFEQTDVASDEDRRPRLAQRLQPERVLPAHEEGDPASAPFTDRP
jgi:hypothetical protein